MPTAIATAGLPTPVWIPCIGALYVRWYGDEVFIWYGGDKAYIHDAWSGYEKGSPDLYTVDGSTPTIEIVEKMAAML